MPPHPWSLELESFFTNHRLHSDFARWLENRVRRSIMLMLSTSLRPHWDLPEGTGGPRLPIHRRQWAWGNWWGVAPVFVLSSNTIILLPLVSRLEKTHARRSTYSSGSVWTTTDKSRGFSRTAPAVWHWRFRRFSENLWTGSCVFTTWKSMTKRFTFSPLILIINF